MPPLRQYKVTFFNYQVTATIEAYTMTSAKIIADNNFTNYKTIKEI